MTFKMEWTVVEELANKSWFPHYWKVEGLEGAVPVFTETRKVARELARPGVDKITKVINAKG